MVSFTLIIPCYNEERNLEQLLSNIKNLKKKINFSIILINNGSTDGSEKKLRNLRKKKGLNFIKIISIKKNIGFGNAIKKGIQNSSTPFICYTHADLQTDILDVYKANKLFKKNKNFLLVKGKRISRSITENIFTLGMGVFNSLIFRVKIFDIHAQPTFFNKKLIKKVKDLPDDFSIDTYLLLLAIYKKYEIVRFKVYFNKRKHGEGSNEGIIKKIFYSYKSLISSVKILINGKF